MLEETGVRLDPDALHPWARWVTPEVEPRRFDTRFFVAELPGRRSSRGRTGGEMDQVAVAAAGATRWRAHGRGELAMWPPTLVTLRELAGCADVDAVVRTRRAAPPRPGPSRRWSTGPAGHARPCCRPAEVVEL